jgi:hypothetical protein
VFRQAHRLGLKTMSGEKHHEWGDIGNRALMVNGSASWIATGRETRMKARARVFSRVASVGAFLSLLSVHVQAATCDLTHYKSLPGLSASVADYTLIVTWDGERSNELRLRLTINGRTPTIQDLSLRRKGAQWITLANNLIPEFHVVTGVRRLPLEQIRPLMSAGVALTSEVVEQNKWEAFWDAPLRIPGSAEGPGAGSVLGWMPPASSVGGVPGLPRTPDEINHASAVFQAQSCEVNTNGARLEITFPGVTLGVFSGKLQYTVYKGTNLIRQEVIAKTEEPSVAYKYDAGLDGLEIRPGSRIVWHDIANNWQDYDFDGSANEQEYVVRAGNRLIAAEVNGGSIAVFPPPHTFFWARELAVNLGYNWHRKDSASRFSLGIREPESEADPGIAGRGPGDWRECFSLKSARPGTWQRMPVYIYVSSGSGETAIGSALSYTREDHYKPLPGYLVMVAHFHALLAQQLQAFGTGLATTLPDVEVLKAAGVNVYAPADGGNLHSSEGMPAKDGALRHVKNLDVYYQIARLHSNKNFWILPAEEITVSDLAQQLGGHTDVLVSHPVLWGQARGAGQALVENDSKYGKVYHIGSPADLMEMVRREDMLLYEPHPRSKASAGYPDAIKDTAYFRDENYGGFGFRWGMGLDGSEQRLCEYRCLALLDETNNWLADLPTPPKYLEAISEIHGMGPGDDVYANNPVSYIKVAELPGIDNWKPIIDAMKRGDHFVTSGEVLIPSYAIEGIGNKRTIVADVEWTFPLEFVEVVWGDGKRVDRQIFSATDLPSFGRHHFEIPFDAEGKKWVRFAVWDSAGDGALVQPAKLSRTPTDKAAMR